MLIVAALIAAFGFMAATLLFAPGAYRAWEGRAREDQSPAGQGRSHLWLYGCIGAAIFGAFAVATLAAIGFNETFNPGAATKAVVWTALYFGVPAALFAAANSRS